MTGLQGELRDRILGSTAHVYVWRTGGISDYHAEAKKLLTVPKVIGAAPAIMGIAIVSSEHGRDYIRLKGIDPGLEPNVTDIGTAIQQGSVDAILNGEVASGILVGKQLAHRSKCQVGDTVNLLTDQGTLSPGGMLRAMASAGGGIAPKLGLREFDAQWGFVSLALPKAGRHQSGQEQYSCGRATLTPRPPLPTAFERHSSYRAGLDRSERLVFSSDLKLGMSIAIGRS
jgi:lipoprotein-releasing system permease protein